MMIRYIIPVGFFFTLVACGSDSGEIKAKEGVVTSTLSNEPLSAEELKKIEKTMKQHHQGLMKLNLDWKKILHGSEHGMDIFYAVEET